jgi:hypothetical protein
MTYLPFVGAERRDHEVHAPGEDAVPLEGGIAQDILGIEPEAE